MQQVTLPSSSDAVAFVAPEPNSINLDLSSRNKIVIHPYKNTNPTNSNTLFPPRSVFKKAKEQASKSSIVENTSHSVAIEANPTPMPQQQVPSPRLRDNDWEAKRVEKVAQVRRAMGRVDKKPTEMQSPSPRVVNLPVGSVTPVIPIPRPEFQSPYLEEYAKCGCTKHNGNPCRRCQLMLLSDRFCALVDLQCKKWSAPEWPKNAGVLQWCIYPSNYLHTM